MAPEGTAGQRLLLASTSPRRHELLRRAAVAFDVAPADGAEPVSFAGELAPDFARRAAIWKAVEAARANPGRLVLGADTVVALHGQVLGKPEGAEDACRMLAFLSGREHQVRTAVACALDEEAHQVRVRCELVTSHVLFLELTPAQISDYVATGEPLDKAGAYGIQGLGGSLVDRYNGSYSNIVGLPLEETLRLVASCRELWLGELDAHDRPPMAQPRLPLHH